eukprot:6775416-Pyramimonas_sp.AAC.1
MPERSSYRDLRDPRPRGRKLTYSAEYNPKAPTRPPNSEAPEAPKQLALIKPQGLQRLNG